MSQLKSNEETVNTLADKIHSTFASAYAIDEKVSHEWLKNVIKEALSQKDKEVEEATKKRMLYKIEKMKEGNDESTPFKHGYRTALVNVYNNLQ